jgi:hypothetical protein
MRSLMLAAMALPLMYLSGSSTQPAAADDPWSSYRFLIGEWVGEGSGQPGQGKGAFSLAPELQGKILLRKNHAEYPASASRPAAVHDDLMIVYQENKEKKAIYFDSEGHVIHYTPSFSQDGQTLTFLSDTTAAAPRFRLSYTKSGAERVQIKFEMAPPDKPDSFKTYLEGGARKKDAR